MTDILYGVRIQEVLGPTNIAIEGIEFDSRKASGYTLFVAVRGTVSDGHDFIDQAIKNGAITIVCEVIPTEPKDHVTYVKVANSAIALGICAANFYDNPSEKLQLVGITGTNGKTTTATLLHRLAMRLSRKSGLLSTVVNMVGDQEVPATHTTPDAVGLNKLLNDMVEAGCKYCFMEVSSHAVDQHRIAGLKFAGAVFTNITHDHLDYHKTFDNYIAAKKQFFDGLSGDAFALYNGDDPHGETMIQDTRAKKRSFGLSGLSDYKAKILENQFSGLVLNIDGNELWAKLIGAFNAFNLLAVYGVAMELGFDKINTLTALSNVNSVEGRFEFVKSKGNITAIVDYAHTPDALGNVLKTIEGIRTGNEMVIVVVGCGGDRDKDKRPVMAEIACKYGDQVILTSDNPRSEDPEMIIQDMVKGVSIPDKRKVLSITNRKEAIKTACSMAHPADILLIAGKGHEKYQEINGEILPFDDFKIVNETLKMLDK